MKIPHGVKSTPRPFWRCFAWRPSRMVKLDYWLVSYILLAGSRACTTVLHKSEVSGEGSDKSELH
jgi:hypothetical protein